MKYPIPLHRAHSLALVSCLLALSCGLVRAQAPVAERLDAYFGENKLLPIDGPIDSFTVAPDNIIKVTKSEDAPGQLTISPVAGGSAELTIKSNGRTLIYDVAVSPAPERLYINLNESKRLSFPNTVDDTSLSQQGIVRVVQPDVSDKVLLVEALTAGKTTLTVTSNKEIYRYFISTFENRGADILAIQNAFSAKGYRNLTIAFDKDQAIISGTVPTQEELDDAVRIVKQFTQFVVVKASLGQEVEASEYSEQEAIIVNNIQRIANVKGLTIRVKFPLPTVVTTSTYTTSTGDYVNPTTTTTPQGGTIRGPGFLPPPSEQQQGPDVTGPTELKPQKNVTETVTTTEDTSVPEKVFLYGDLQDDLEEAKVIRVARTFCPFIVSFLTVKDPIQIRTQLRFMQVKSESDRTTGFNWTGGGTGPSITLGVGPGAFDLVGGAIHNPVSAFVNFITSPGSAFSTIDASAVLNLFETEGTTKILREADIFLTNGQPGWYSEGEVQAYVSSAVQSASSPPITTLTASFVFLGVNMDISPLNLVSAGGVEPQGQKIFGIPASVGAGANSYTLEQDNEPTADKVGKINVPIQKSGGIPIVDNTVKYVDENGLIGMNISTQLTIPNGPINSAANRASFGTGADAPFVTLPDFFVRTTRTRVNLRDGQTIAINGLIDKELTHSITQVPFFASIPLFSSLFKSHDDAPSNEEILVLITPHIVRMRDSESSRYPKPVSPELQDMAREYGDVPLIKPVRYDAKAVDLRPETPKDMEDGKNAVLPSEQAPLALHVGGGMQPLLPPANSSSVSTSSPAVDNTLPAQDISRQPSSAPLAPYSTLP